MGKDKRKSEREEASDLWQRIVGMCDKGWKGQTRDFCALECLANAPLYVKPDSQKIFLLWEAKCLRTVQNEVGKDIEGVKIEIIPGAERKHGWVCSLFIAIRSQLVVRFPFNTGDASDWDCLSWNTIHRNLVTKDYKERLLQLPRWSTASRSCLALIPEKAGTLAPMAANERTTAEDRVQLREKDWPHLNLKEWQEWETGKRKRFREVVSNPGAAAGMAGMDIKGDPGIPAGRYRLYSVKTGVKYVGSKDESGFGKNRLEANCSLAMHRSEVIESMPNKDETFGVQTEVLTITAPFEKAPSTFSVGDLVDVPSLAGKLKQPADSVSIYLKGLLSREAAKALEKYQDAHSDPKPLQGVLVEDLNRIIDGPSIHDVARFTGVILRPETQHLLTQKPQEEALVRLNRLLLEDAYPLEISQKSFIVRDGFQVRDLSCMRPGLDYIPGQAIPYARATFDKLTNGSAPRQNADEQCDFWRKVFAVPLGRAKARLFLNYGLVHTSANAQNFLLGFQGNNCIQFVARDIGDTSWHDDYIEKYFAADTPIRNAFQKEKTSKEVRHLLRETSSGAYPPPRIVRLAAYSVLTHDFATVLKDKAKGNGWSKGQIYTFTTGILDGFRDFVQQASGLGQLYPESPGGLGDGPVEEYMTCPTDGGRGASLLHWAAIDAKGSHYGRQEHTIETVHRGVQTPGRQAHRRGRRHLPPGLPATGRQ